jgi:GMP synthase-like glutamine amidotransferase
MKAALLICDHIRPELLHIDGEYTDMFAELLPEIELTPYRVCDGEFPMSVEDHSAYICTGSRFSVYEDLPWIEKLKEFIRLVAQSDRKLIGICFGHQMIAEALGGKVQKASAGWCIGIQEFQLTNIKIEGLLKPLSLLMMCQDQITKLPEGSQILAKSEKCPIGIFTVNNQFLGIQAHPEFSREYNKALSLHLIEQIGKEKVEEAKTNLNQSLSTKEIRLLMMSFLR